LYFTLLLGVRFDFDRRSLHGLCSTEHPCSSAQLQVESSLLYMLALLALLALLFYPKCPPQVYSSAILLFEHMAVVHLLVLQKLKGGDVCGTAKVGYGVTRHTAACWQLQICKLSCWWVSAADKLTTHNSSSIHSIALILSPFILLFFKFSICFWCDHSSLRTA
jgi:hypothetical protein